MAGGARALGARRFEPAVLGYLAKIQHLKGERARAVETARFMRGAISAARRAAFRQ